MRIIILFILFLISPILSATHYYVKTGGNDGAAGTSDGTAWATVSKVNSMSFSPGDIISFNKGDTFTGTRLYPGEDGTALNNITYNSYGTGDNPVIVYSGYFCLYLSSRDYITVDGLTFDGYLETSSSAVKVDGDSHHNTITNCVIKNSYSCGILITGGCEYNTLSHCNIYNNDRNGPGVSPQGYSVYLSGNYNTIEYNEIHDETSYGIHIYDGYGTDASYNIVRYNYCHDNGSAGILSSINPGNEIYYNIVVRNANVGIRVQWGADDTKVYNNTVYDNTSYGIYLGSDCSGVICRNNIVYGNDATIYNGAGTLSNNLTTNPLFLNAGGSYLLDTDFKISSSSPAKDAGTNVSLIVDYFGVTVPYNTTPDIGANEYEVPDDPIDPVVIYTNSVTVGTTTATTGGNVIDDGGGTVSERGVAYGSSVNPTIAGSHTSDGTGTGTFISNISGLTEATTYHVRAYATNEAGTYYGADVEFTTTSDQGLSGSPVFINGKVLFKDGKIVIR